MRQFELKFLFFNIKINFFIIIKPKTKQTAKPISLSFHDKEGKQLSSCSLVWPEEKKGK